MNYRAALKHSLQKQDAGLNCEQINLFLCKYDALCIDNTKEEAFRIILENYGNEEFLKATSSYASAVNYQLPQTKVGKMLEDSLTEANKLKVEANSIFRIRKIISTYNKNLDKCNCELTNYRGTFNVLNPDDIEKLKIRTFEQPKKAAMAYEAWANFKEGRFN